MLKRKSKKEEYKYDLFTKEQLVEYLFTSGVEIKDPTRQVTLITGPDGVRRFNKAVTNMLKAETELLRAEIEDMPKHERRTLK
jgi:hypothetical protein